MLPRFDIYDYLSILKLIVSISRLYSGKYVSVFGVCSERVRHKTGGCNSRKNNWLVRGERFLECRGYEMTF